MTTSNIFFIIPSLTDKAESLIPVLERFRKNGLNKTVIDVLTQLTQRLPATDEQVETLRLCIESFNEKQAAIEAIITDAVDYVNEDDYKADFPHHTLNESLYFQLMQCIGATSGIDEVTSNRRSETATVNQFNTLLNA